MTDAFTIKVRGLKETQAALYTFSRQLGDKVVLGALRQGATIVLKAARENAPRGPTGRLKRGIVLRASKIKNGKKGTGLIGVYIGISNKKKNDPYYGRFVEYGWNTHGKQNAERRNYRSKYLLTRRSIGNSRVTQAGKTNVPGQEFINKAWLDNRDRALSMIIEAANAGARVVAKRLGFKYGG